MPGPKKLISVRIVSALAVGLLSLFCLLWLPLTPFPRFDRIRDLEGAAIGDVVNIQGVVTYTDSSVKEFWIQDSTGAISVAQDPRIYGIRTGETLELKGRKKIFMTRSLVRVVLRSPP